MYLVWSLIHRLIGSFVIYGQAAYRGNRGRRPEPRPCRQTPYQLMVNSAVCSPLSVQATIAVHATGLCSVTLNA